MLILSIVISLAVILVLAIFNNLVKLKNLVREAWSGIDIQLKRRAELIPILVETVKGYAKHEQEVLEKVTQARLNLTRVTGPEASALANDQLTQNLNKLFLVAEQYPELKAVENFLNLQKQLGDTEDRIAYSRQYYNASVAKYNNKIKTFPAVLLAGLFGFQPAEFFQTAAEAKEGVKINF